MHIEVQYLNEGACRIFGTTKQAYVNKNYRLDELIHPEDKSIVFQAIGKAMATDGECDLEIRTIVHKASTSGANSMPQLGDMTRITPRFSMR